MNDERSDYSGSIIIGVVALVAVALVLVVAGLCGAGIVLLWLAR